MIRAQVLTSLKWLAAARIAGQGVAVVISVIVVRLLDPADYGLMAITGVFLGLVLLLNEMGMGAALIQQKDLERREIEQAFGLLLMINLVLYVTVYFSAPLVAAFFREPRVAPILQVVALRLPLVALLVVPRAMLQRNLRYREKSIVDLLGMVSASIGTLVLALLGFGVWALACGALIGAAMEVLGVYSVSRTWVRPRFSLQGMRRQATFGGYVTADRILWYLYTRADAAVVGRVIGSEPLGVYYIAKKFASLPLDFFGGVFTQVGFSAYSRIQHDTERLRSHYCKVARLASAISFPLCFGLSAVAPEAVTLILGPQWSGAVVPMQLVALAAPLRQLNALNTPALLGVGRPEVNVVNLVIALVIMPTAFVVGTQWGLIGVALAWAVAYPVYFIIMLSRSLSVLGIPHRRYLDAIWFPIVTAGVMYGAVALLRAGLEIVGAPSLLVLMAGVGTGALVYTGIVSLMRPELVREFLSLVGRQTRPT